MAAKTASTSKSTKVVLLLRLRLIFILLLALTGISGWWALTPMTPPATVRLEVEPGASLIQVARKLENQQVIRSALALRLLAKFNPELVNIQAGHYSFSASASLPQILHRLQLGDVDQLRFTVPEGFSLRQIAQRGAEVGLVDAEALLAAARDPRLLQSLNIPASDLEGYLFPETYQFAQGVTAENILRTMFKEFERQYARLPKPAAAASLDRHQLVTLASIIQKESALADEMPLISAVFHNRLQRDMRLQTDPTVIYALPDFNGNLTRRDLETPSPYNTYRHHGLPPGPIASPGLEALRAAVQPAQSDDLYFVARGDGSHEFSATLKEHNRAVRTYQLNR